jgi:branched-chain amino acid transport system permease protein
MKEELALEKAVESRNTVAHSLGVKRWFALILPAAAVLLLPLVLNAYLTSVLVIIGLYSITTLGITLLMGYAGLVSLAQAAFWGIGAYVTGILAVSFGIDPWLGLLFGVLVSASIALALGWITRNLEGHYFSLATLGFGIVVNIVLIEESEWTGGPSGLIGVPGLSIGEFAISGDTVWFYFVWTIVLLGVWLLRNLVQSGWGRNLRSIQASVAAAESMGIPSGRYRMSAFVISALFAGLSGGLYACYMSFISPAIFNFDMSIKFVVMAVLGGLGSIWGAIFGVVIVTLLVELLREYVPQLLGHTGSGGPIEIIFFGILLVVMMIYMPNGLIGLLHRKWRGRKSAHG